MGWNFESNYLYEEKSVNKQKIDIKLKIMGIQTFKKHLFLDIPSSNIDKFVASLYQRVETRRIEVFWLLS
jgi:hypothetical protein